MCLKFQPPVVVVCVWLLPHVCRVAATHTHTQQVLKGWQVSAEKGVLQKDLWQHMVVLPARKPLPHLYEPSLTTQSTHIGHVRVSCMEQHTAFVLAMHTAKRGVPVSELLPYQCPFPSAFPLWGSQHCMVNPPTYIWRQRG